MKLNASISYNKHVPAFFANDTVMQNQVNTFKTFIFVFYVTFRT